MVSRLQGKDVNKGMMTKVRATSDTISQRALLRTMEARHKGTQSVDHVLGGWERRHDAELSIPECLAWGFGSHEDTNKHLG